MGLVVGPAYAQTPRIGLIFAEGGLGDQSFNDAAYAGLMAARDELGVEVVYVEPADIAEMEGLCQVVSGTFKPPKDPKVI